MLTWHCLNGSHLYNEFEVSSISGEVVYFRFIN